MERGIARGIAPGILSGLRRLGIANDIGISGGVGFGVGTYPGSLPAGFTSLSGTYIVGSTDYGNYEYADGSIMCWIPAFFYKIGTGSNGLDVNVIDVKPESAYADEAAANTDGYALHRAFKDGGETKRGFFVDKYQASNNSGTASSIALGDPLSTNLAHNPLSGLTGISTNNYATCIDAAKTRGSQFFPSSRFIQSALAMLSMAHGQAASSTDYCAWYDASGVTNFPKGCNNNALGDVNDGTISYTSDGYSNCGKTGSGTPFAKTTHNGQETGVADLNGNMWEIGLGLTRDSGNADFYALKPAVAMQDLTSGSVGGNDAWGSAAHLATLYDVLAVPYITNASAWRRYGNAGEQVLDESVSGAGWMATGLALPRSADGWSAGGTNLFGADAMYEFHRALLCVLSGGAWGSGSISGVWAGSLDGSRTNSYGGVGFRAACYFV